MANPSAAKALVKALAVHLRTQIPELQAVNEGFPSANDELKYPCVTIMPGEPEFSPYPASLHSKTDTSASNQAYVKWLVGQYDFKLQLDLWCSSKAQRHDFYERIFQAFSTQLPVMGISLTLSEYHELSARYDLVGYQPPDDEANAQRREWRLTMTVLASCSAIRETIENIIVETEPTVSASETELIEE